MEPLRKADNSQLFRKKQRRGLSLSAVLCITIQGVGGQIAPRVMRAIQFPWLPVGHLDRH